MTSVPFVRPVFTAMVIVAAFAVNVPAQLVIYRETFGRDPANGTGNIGTQNFDWGRWNQVGTLTSTTSGVNGTDNGNPIDLPNVNAGPYYQNAGPGPFARGWLFLDGTARLAMTPEYSFNPADYPTGVTFSWYQGNQTSPGVQDFKLAVQVGGSWYASVTTFSNTPVPNGAAFGTGSEKKSFVYNPAAANWTTLDFNGTHDVVTHISTASTVPLALGSTPAADLSGPITAFGLYRDGTGQNGRFDSFTIEVNAILGDTNGNGIGGEYPADFDPIKDNFRKTGRSRMQGDLTGDGKVDFADFREWRAVAMSAGTSLDGIDFGTMFGAVPEPGTGLMFVIAAAVLTTFRRRRSHIHI